MSRRAIQAVSLAKGASSWWRVDDDEGAEGDEYFTLTFRIKGSRGALGPDRRLRYAGPNNDFRLTLEEDDFAPVVTADRFDFAAVPGATEAATLTVTWSAPANAGPAITDYDVQYRAGTSGDWSDGNHTGATTTATLTGLAENTSHQVQVRATNAEGTGSWSDSGSGATDANAPPPVEPQAEAVEGSYTSLVVSWTAPDTGAGAAVTGYELRYRERPVGRWEDWPHDGTATTATIDGLEVNTVYEVEARALYGEMQSAWAGVPGQARTGAPPPAWIRNVTLVSGPGSDGIWSAGERVEVEVRYTEPVEVERPACWTLNADGTCRPPGPYMVVAFSSDARPGYGEGLSAALAPYVRGSGTNVLTFAYTVGAAEDGARGAWAAHSGMLLRGATIRTLEGGDGASRYTNTRVRQVDLEKPAGGAWTAGDTVRVAVRFAGPVQYTPPDEPRNRDEVFVDETGGTPTIRLPRVGDAPDPLRSRTARYERGSGTDTLTFEYAVGAGDGRVSAVEVVADSLERNGATIRNEEGYDAELEHVSVLWYSSLALRGSEPVAVSVADARVREAPGATLNFAATLSGPASNPVTVDYRTVDGSARAGSDYRARQGKLRFAPGETQKTVSVPVLDDAHDEGEETMRLRLTAASGAMIADGEATGTIENADHMPAAWLARFGRTVAAQGKHIVPTERGLALFKVLGQADPALVDPGVTAEFECLLDDVLTGGQPMMGAIDAVCDSARRIIGTLAARSHDQTPLPGAGTAAEYIANRRFSL